MRNVYSTAGLGPDEKSEYWSRSMLSVCGDFDTRTKDWDGFYGDIDVRNLGGFDVAGLSLNPEQVVRSRAQVANSNDEYCFLILQLAGKSRLEQGARDILLMPGDMTLIDSGMPSKFDYDGPFRQLSFHLPRKVLEARLHTRRLPYASLISGSQGMGAVTSGFMKSMYDQALLLRPDQAETIRDALLEMVTSCVGQCSGMGNAGTASPKGQQLRQLQQYIDARLADPNLSPGGIAKSYGISTRHLHRLFELSGMSVGEWMRNKRLERARDDLANPKFADHSVIQIAFNWGFNDASHFSRTFKAAFGMTPRQYKINQERVVTR